MPSPLYSGGARGGRPTIDLWRRAFVTVFLRIVKCDLACRVSPHNTGRARATHRRKTTFLVQCLIAIGAVLGLAGCAAEPDFQLNSAHLVRLERDFRQPLGERRRDDLQQVLEDLFGTPEHPRIPDVVSPSEVRFDLERLAAAAGPVASDEQGNARGLYRTHCVNCHGITGDGVGPTATFVNPYPRDFRRGLYKFKSTPKGEKPTDEDLRLIIVNGIPGTAMPAYQALPDRDAQALQRSTSDT